MKKIICRDLLSLLLLLGLSACDSDLGDSTIHSSNAVPQATTIVNKEFTIEDMTKLGGQFKRISAKEQTCQNGVKDIVAGYLGNANTQHPLYNMVDNVIPLYFQCKGSLLQPNKTYKISIDKSILVQVDQDLHLVYHNGKPVDLINAQDAVSIVYDDELATYVLHIKAKSIKDFGSDSRSPIADMAAVNINYKKQYTDNEPSISSVQVGTPTFITPNGNVQGWDIDAPHMLGSNVISMSTYDKIKINVAKSYLVDPYIDPVTKQKLGQYVYNFDYHLLGTPVNNKILAGADLAWGYEFKNNTASGYSCDIAGAMVANYNNETGELSFSVNPAKKSALLDCVGKPSATLSLYFGHGLKVETYDYVVKLVAHRVVGVRPVDPGRGDPQDPDTKDYYSSDIYMPLNENYHYGIPYKLTYDDGSEQMLTTDYCKNNEDYGCSLKANITNGGEYVKITSNDDNDIVTLQPIAKTPDGVSAKLKTEFTFFERSGDGYKYNQESVSDIYVSNSATIQKMELIFSDASYNKESFNMWVGDKRHFTLLATTNDDKKLDFTTLANYTTVAANAKSEENPDAISPISITSIPFIKNFKDVRVELTGIAGGFANLHANLGDIDFRYTLNSESAYPVGLLSSSWMKSATVIPCGGHGDTPVKNADGTTELYCENYLTHPLMNKSGQFWFDMNLNMSNGTTCHAEKISDCGGLKASVYSNLDNFMGDYVNEEVLADDLVSGLYKFSILPIHGYFNGMQASKVVYFSGYNTVYEHSGPNQLIGRVSNQGNEPLIRSIVVKYPQAVYSPSGITKDGEAEHSDNNGSATNFDVSSILAQILTTHPRCADSDYGCIWYDGNKVVDYVGDFSVNYLVNANYKTDAYDDALGHYVTSSSDKNDYSVSSKEGVFNQPLDKMVSYFTRTSMRSVYEMTFDATTHYVDVLAEDFVAPRSHGKDSHRYEFKVWVDKDNKLWCKDLNSQRSAGITNCNVIDYWNPQIIANVRMYIDGNKLVCDLSN